LNHYTSLDFTVHKPVFDYRADLANGDYQHAEELVAESFRLQGYEVCDCRDDHRLPDFVMDNCGHEFTLDVKYDRWIEHTKNFCFERARVYDGDWRAYPSWGWDESLDYVAVVGVSYRYARIVLMHDLRQYINDLVGIPWREQPCPNKDKVTGSHFVAHNWLIPVAELEREGIMQRDPWPLPTMERSR
jgi:hypothetical protein